MKRTILLLLVLIFICITGCEVPHKKEMLEICSNDENYFTLEGEIIEISDMDENYAFFVVTIKCEELKQYVLYENDVCRYWIFSEENINIQEGDIVSFTTVDVLMFFDWLPIVSITKDNISLLEFNEGKNNLINFVYQLQYK